MAISTALANATLSATANGTGNDTVKAALNATLNSTMDKAAALVPVAQSFIPLVFIRLWELIAAPFRHGEMLWIIIPLFFSLIVMEFYYDRHDDEELGWGASLANSLVLIFVAIDLIKTAFDGKTPWLVLKEIVLYVFSNTTIEIAFPVVLLIAFLGCLGIALTLITYFHLLPRKIAYIVAGHPPVNFLAYFAIAIVYSTHTSHPIPFDLATLVAGALLFILILLAVFGLKKLFARITGSGPDRKKGIWD